MDTPNPQTALENLSQYIDAQGGEGDVKFYLGILKPTKKDQLKSLPQKMIEKGKVLLKKINPKANLKQQEPTSIIVSYQQPEQQSNQNTQQQTFNAKVLLEQPTQNVYLSKNQDEDLEICLKLGRGNPKASLPRRLEVNEEEKKISVVQQRKQKNVFSGLINQHKNH